MHDSLPFLESFIAAENAALIAINTEKSNARVDKLIAKAAAFYGEECPIDLARPDGRDAAFLAEGKAQLDQYKPRIVIKLERYQHPKLGELHRVFLNNPIRSGKKTLYYETFFVRHAGESFSIVAVQLICRDCAAVGAIDGAKCPSCKGLGFIHDRGVKLASFGKRVDVLKRVPPDKPEHRQEYDRS